MSKISDRHSKQISKWSQLNFLHICFIACQKYEPSDFGINIEHQSQQILALKDSKLIEITQNQKFKTSENSKLKTQTKQVKVQWTNQKKHPTTLITIKLTAFGVPRQSDRQGSTNDAK